MDVVVIGAGPAGMAAAAELAGGGLDVVLVEGTVPGGQLFEETTLVPPSGPPTTGDDLAVALQEEVAARGVRFEFGEAVGLALSGATPVVDTTAGRFAPRAVVVATGTRRRPIATEAGPVPEEMTCHCLPCDGPMLAGRRIVLVGTGAPFARDVALCREITPDVCVVTDGEPPADPDGLQVQPGTVVEVAGRPGDLRIQVRDPEGALHDVAAAAVVSTGGFEPVTGWIDPSLLEPGGWLADRHGPALRAAGSVVHDLRHADPFAVERDGRRVAAELAASLVG